MRRRGVTIPLLSLLLCAAAGSSALAQKTVNDLCRLHGVDGREDIARIEQAYVGSVLAGIPEDELLPFVEDILRHKLDCGQMVRVLAVTSRLRAEDLPYQAVFSKVREGVAKEAPPVLVVVAAEAKYKTLTGARDVLVLLQAAGYSIHDFQKAVVVVSSYIEKGYEPAEIVSQIRTKGVQGAGFVALSGVVGKPK